MRERQLVLLWMVVGAALVLVLGVSVSLVTYTVVDTAASQELRAQVLELRTALENLTGTADTASPAPALLAAVAGLSARLDHVVSSLSSVQTQTQELRDAVDALSTRVDTNTRALSDVSNRSLGLQTTLGALSTTVGNTSNIMSEVKFENARLNKAVLWLFSSLNETNSSILTETMNLDYYGPTKSPQLLDCQYYQSLGLPSGVYTVDPQDGQPAFPAFCDMDTEGGAWLVFQRREDGSVNFTRNWANYSSGFGDLKKEFWLGLEKLHRLTSAGMTRMRVDLATWRGKTAYALYSTFRVGSSRNNFRLKIRGYSGTAGDGVYHRKPDQYTANGMQFSTYDRGPSSINCARRYKAGWWFNSCHRAHPNGVYGSQGSEGGHYLHWRAFTHNRESLKFLEMKIK